MASTTPATVTDGDVRRSWLPRRPPHTDVAIALAFVTLALAEVVTFDAMGSALRHALLSALPLTSLAWRRQYPEIVALLVACSNILGNPDLQFTIVLSLVLCGYTVGSRLDPPRSYLGLAAMLAPFMVGVLTENGFVPSDFAAAAVFIVGPWVVGTAVRRRTASVQQAVLLAEERAREQERRAHEAAATERARIARELHDIVSHSLSVVTIQTQAVRRRLRPEQVEEARDLGTVETTAREALAEMRRLFGVLRAEGESASLTPQPGLAQLPRLVSSVAGGRPEVRLVEEGDRMGLPPGLDLAAYRIAQEGLTNALRHAGASAITVTVRCCPDAVEIEVRDNGRGPRADDPTGHGMVGIRERVGLYQGTVRLEGVPGGGARLVARLPLSSRI